MSRFFEISQEHDQQPRNRHHRNNHRHHIRRIRRCHTPRRRIGKGLLLCRGHFKTHFLSCEIVVNGFDV